MDATESKKNPNPREKANIISVAIWWWTVKIFRTGYRKPLGPEDLFVPLKKDKSDYLGDKLESQWMKELEQSKKVRKKPSLLKAIFKTFWLDVAAIGTAQICTEIITSIGLPMLLGGLLRNFQEDGGLSSDSNYQRAVYFAIALCALNLLDLGGVNHWIYGALHLGGRARAATCSIVYRKALKLSVTALGETAPGKIVNLVANDVNRFDMVSIFLNYMWLFPTVTLVIGYILYTETGWAGLVGIVVIFLVVPIQTYTSKLTYKYRLQTALKTDERVRLMDEIISGVQVIKMYAWEKPFSAMIALARKLELSVIKKISYIRGIFMTFFLFTTRIALFSTLITMLLTGETLTADKVFVMQSYFNVIAQSMSWFMRGFSEIAEFMVSIRRLQNFLTYEEFHGEKPSSAKVEGKPSQVENLIRNSIESFRFIDDDDSKNHSNGFGSVTMSRKNDVEDVNAKNTTTSKSSCVAVNLQNVCAKWENSKEDYILEDVNLKIEEGKLYLVIGLVGAGKTSLLSAILNEMILSEESSIDIKGTLSYASQEAWVFGSTVRQNITFGQPYDPRRYQRVIKVCALDRDFLQFPNGDQTLVGDRGTSLSGGQKARINLARCLYKQADIYVLDDPLSAVDAHVSKHLFDECMLGYLRGKTRILATHQLQFLTGADRIILVEQGKMIMYDNHKDLLAARPEYGHLIAVEHSSTVNEPASNEREFVRLRSYSSRSSRSGSYDGEMDSYYEKNTKPDEETTNDELLEETSRGIIKGSIFLKYFRTGAHLTWAFLVLFLFFLTQCTVSLTDLFVSILVDANITPAEKDDEKRATYIYIYTALVVSIFLTGITRSVTFVNLCMLCNQKLHDLGFGALIRTPMRFFDTNPSGRILNRFSKDLGTIDELIPRNILDAGQFAFWAMGIVIVVCYVNPIFLAPLVFIGIFFIWSRIIYLTSSQNIKRLEGITKSPVFTHLNSSLYGLTTIRAYGAQEILKQEFDNFQDSHSSAWFLYITTSQAYAFLLNVFCLFFTTLVIFSFIIFHKNFTGSDAGLAITQVMSMTLVLEIATERSSEVSNQMMSVERVMEYTKLPPEENLRDPSTTKKSREAITTPVIPDTPKGWPSKGHIKFINASLRYAEDEEPVLRNLNLDIMPKEKVGIVGRTGAGKSSLISALFRLAKISGTIEIDGIDTGNIYLEDLRTAISIIPQDPFLYSGTIRRNLDPFNDYTDDNIWEALEEVELKEVFVSSGSGLETRVLDRGSNYSVGQRQLVCLARAILRNNRVLLLDEATANVDPHTDSLIQRTIREKFAMCTVLTVAHRLNTIMDSDKVLVMDKGAVKEFDHPHVLLQDEDSAFTSLVKETGSAMHEQLAKVAKKAYTDKHENR